MIYCYRIFIFIW